MRRLRGVPDRGAALALAALMQLILCHPG
jgi:hypothetical protein